MSDLRKTLGVTRGTALMLNIVMGAGLLTLPGLALRQAGEQAIWIWLGCALAAAPLLAVFAMIGRRFPDAGGIPAFAGNQFGRTGYTAGTFLFLGAVTLGLPAVAITGGYYAATIINLSPYVLGAGLVMLATLVNFLSAELAGRVNSVIASALIFVLVVIVVLGGYAVAGGVPSPTLQSTPLNIDTETCAAVFMMIFFAFTGWEVAAHLSEEFRNPQRDLPLAMALSFLIALCFYLALAQIVAMSGLSASYEAPFVAILSASYGSWAGVAMAVTATVMIFANLSAAIWAVSRMVFSCARQGLLPSTLAITSAGTPARAVMAVLVAMLAAIGLASQGILPLDTLLEYAGQNFLVLYGIGAVALFVASDQKRIKAVSGIAILVVLTILAMRDAWAMLYPVALVLAAYALDRAVKSRV
ncbi:amino acid permease [Aureimonas fodinaquatilis]|uniref:Amino acid permease n=1 Tax=Aureimonas fodinaquatilis TaxID=2565783 RepID=A0A5B0E099_9HYPH|nr:amino acid permease [Aureimonas fodinaquatilis]KAA0972116.1 amino acid permease [Aureimonas fodinaquatilis]